MTPRDPPALMMGSKSPNGNNEPWDKQFSICHQTWDGKSTQNLGNRVKLGWAGKKPNSKCVDGRKPGQGLPSFANPLAADLFWSVYEAPSAQLRSFFCTFIIPFWDL